MKKIDYDKLIAHETRKQTASLWGESIEFEPVLCSTIFGDGLQLVYLGTIDQRPYHWLIRIDSKTDIEDENFYYEILITTLEDEFGRHPNMIIDEEEFNDGKKNNPIRFHEWENFKEYKQDCEYPRIWWNGGYWGMVANITTNTLEDTSYIQEN